MTKLTLNDREVAMGWRSRELELACPLEELVIRLSKLLEHVINVF